jgi:ABC-type sugar transport system substrate-binding protein
LIEWITDGRRDDYGCSMLTGAKSAARSAGVELRVRDTASVSANAQAALLAQAVTDRANAVVLDSVDDAQIFLPVRFAHDQGVPVVLLHQPPTGDPGFAWSVVIPDPVLAANVTRNKLQQLRAGALNSLVVPGAHQVGTAAVGAAVRASFRQLASQQRLPTQVLTRANDPEQTCTFSG